MRKLLGWVIQGIIAHLIHILIGANLLWVPMAALSSLGRASSYETRVLILPLSISVFTLVALVIIQLRQLRERAKGPEGPPYWRIHHNLGWEITPAIVPTPYYKILGVGGPFCPKAECRRSLTEGYQTQLERTSTTRDFPCLACNVTYSVSRSLTDDQLKLEVYEEWEAEQRRKLPSA